MYVCIIYIFLFSSVVNSIFYQLIIIIFSTVLTTLISIAIGIFNFLIFNTLYLLICYI